MMEVKKVNALPDKDIAYLSALFPNKSWDEYYWRFFCASRSPSWGPKLLDDEADLIMVELSHINGGELGELSFAWYDHSDRFQKKPLAPRLEAFHDGWPLLHAPTFMTIVDQLTQLGRSHAPTSVEVSALLITNGFTDTSDQPCRFTAGVQKDG